jgi:hypothetical protein
MLGAICPIRNNLNTNPAMGILSRSYGTDDITFVNRSKLLVAKLRKNMSEGEVP